MPQVNDVKSELWIIKTESKEYYEIYWNEKKVRFCFDSNIGESFMLFDADSLNRHLSNYRDQIQSKMRFAKAFFDIDGEVSIV